MEADKGKRHTVWASAEHVAEFEKMLSLEKEFPGKSLARDELINCCNSNPSSEGNVLTTVHPKKSFGVKI